MKNQLPRRVVSPFTYIISSLCLLLCFLVPPTRATVPSGLTLTGANIGAGTGGEIYNAGTDSFAVTGTGDGLWFGAGMHPDNDHFSYTTATGDMEIVARLVSFDNPGNGQTGLMIRQSNSSNEVNKAATWFWPKLNGGDNNIASVGYGPPVDGDAYYYNSGYYIAKPALNPPYWLKLVRVGQNYGAYWSLNGRDWNFIGNNSGGALMGTGTFNVGFFVDNYFGSTGASTAIFDNVYIGAPRLKYKTSWIGATSVGVADGNPSNQIYSMWVKPDDGACYTNSNWDEGGETGKIYKDGKVFHRFLGPGINGAYEGTITGNASNIFYYNMLPTPGVWRSDFTTANPVQLTFTGTPLGEVRGLAASATMIFVSDYAHGLVRMVDAATLTEVGTPIVLPRCGPIAYDGTNFWVIQAATQDVAGTALSTHTVGTFTPSIRCYSPTGADLSTTHPPITWADGGIPTALAYQDLAPVGTTSSNDVLWVCDNGPHQYIREYNNLTGTPAVMTAFGQDGGLWPTGSANQGKITDSAYGGDKRFYGPVGIGLDSIGNIYVACNGATGAVTDVRKFNSTGTLQWRVNGLVFLHNGDFDPSSDGQEYYIPDKHFTLNNANTAPGSEWSYKGYTRDIRLNANEGRNQIAPLAANLCGVKLARLGTPAPGKLYMYTSGQGKMGPSWLYYFNGETAIPFGYNYHDTSTGGIHRLWIDANNNQTVDTGEEMTLPNPGGEAIAFDVDSAGDIWMNFQGVIRRIMNQGTQQIGTALVPVPKYSLNSGGYEDYRAPAPLTTVWNLNYDRTNDILYAVGKKADGNWALARCDQWRTNPENKTDPVATWCVNLVQQSDITILYPPPEGNWAYFGLDVAGDKIFVAEIYGPIHVYDTATGNPVIQLIQGPEVSARFGWDDMVMGVSAVKRSTGEYLVTEEGAGWNASDLLYRWTPAADTAVTTAPTALTATAVGRKVVLTWAGPTGMVTSYKLYRGTTSGGETLYQSGIKGPTLTDLNVTPGVMYYYKVTAVNAMGESAQSNEANAMPSGTQAEFVKYDVTTKGSWNPTGTRIYGTDGYVVAGASTDVVSNPTYGATPTVVASNIGRNHYGVESSDPITDVRGLQLPSGSGRTGFSWDQGAVGVPEIYTISFSDPSQWHQVSLYMVQWNAPGANQPVVVKDTATGAVLDTRQPMDYAGGKWLVWNIRGNVTITISQAVGYAEAAGIFFDPVQVSTPAIAWWKFDETSGTTGADSSGAGHNAILSGATWDPSGKINRCVKIPGGTARVNLPTSLIAGHIPITLSAWFKTSSITGAAIAGYANSSSSPSIYVPALYVGIDGKLRGTFYTGSTSSSTVLASTTTVNNGAWHHAALVGDAGTQTLYLDGNVVDYHVGTILTTSLPYNYLGYANVSGWPSMTGTTNNFNGWLDDVRIYDKALKGSQIYQLANP